MKWNIDTKICASPDCSWFFPLYYLNLSLLKKYSVQQHFFVIWWMEYCNIYLLRSKGDNLFSSVPLSVRPSICLGLWDLSVSMSQRLFVCFYWHKLVDDGTWLAKCSIKAYETQVRYTYKIITRWSSQRVSKWLHYQNDHVLSGRSSFFRSFSTQLCLMKVILQEAVIRDIE